MKKFFIRLFKEKSSIKFKYYFNKDKELGFVLPQILILSIGVALGITGLIAVSINRLSTNRVALLESQARNSAESGVATVQSLLNNSKTGVLYYYWLAKTCSLDAQNSDCYTPLRGSNPNIWPGIPVKGYFPDLSNMYWTDTGGLWCNGRKNCLGRQIAPKCTYLGSINSGSIPWFSYSSGLTKLLDRNKDKVGFDVKGAKSNYQQSFSLKATDFVGSETSGTTAFVIEGYSQPINSPNTNISSNKLRADISITKIVTPQAFGVISAGENEADGDLNLGQSLYMGNFRVSGDKVGSIIWRKNMYFNSNCAKIGSKIGAIRSYLPDNAKGSGGIWIQPISFPPRPSFKSTKGIINLDSIFCHKKNQSNCKILSTSINTFPNTERIVTIDDLFVYGKDGIFEITTSNQSRIKLLVRGSIHVANEGHICHKNKGNNRCGSGDPENLTIMFEQPGQNSLPSIGTLKGKSELACSSNGGITLRENNEIPFNTFIVSNTTGTRTSDKFSAFVYGPQTTFATTKSIAPYYQKPVTGMRNIVISRGVYGFIDNPDGPNHDRSPRLIKSPNGKLIPFQNNNSRYWDSYMNNLEVIATGRKISDPGSTFYENVALVWDKKNKIYSLRGMNITSNFQSGGNNISTEGQLVPTNVNGGYVSLGNTPFTLAPNGQSWISYYGIELEKNKQKVDKNFKSIVWMKNVCFDDSGFINWDFDLDLSTKLVERFANIDFNYGVPFYRGQSVKVWDTLRNFD